MGNKSRAQIVATIGPASKNYKTILEMAKHQMDVARLNFSHGTYAEHSNYIKNIKLAAKQLKKQIPIIQDLSGPRTQNKSGHHLNEKIKSAITEKDIQDLKFGLKNKVDYVALSYVASGNDIKNLRKLMKKFGAQKPIIAKIERREAIKNLASIIKTADAIMIARGDLGLAYPIEKVPALQKMIIKKCKIAKKPVITATEMLLSMKDRPQPTRAEVTDVTEAILEGSDAVMLSEETAIGKYPVETVAAMEKIIKEAEKHEKFKIHSL
ncbi:MAG: pyruvate kinase [bacterium]|nr:pyruvate kinase [bacterium]